MDRAVAGEEIVIAKSGRALARLVPLEDARARRAIAEAEDVYVRRTVEQAAPESGFLDW